MRLTLVVGARPNFIKIAPIIRSIEKSNVPIAFRLVHSGQHYDDALSASFFRDLNIPAPDVNLAAGSGSQAEQTAAIMVAFEKELLRHPTDAVVVVGDVNSTLACSIAAKKLNIDVIHVEAGIRSGDRSMPEEINRIVTDSITDFFFTTTPGAGTNLEQVGISPNRIFLVGNTMIDSLVENLDRLKQPDVISKNNLKGGDYLVLTLHRPNNVDSPEILHGMLDTIVGAAGNLPIIFPVHPRTIIALRTLNVSSRIIQCEPLRYLEFMWLVKNSVGAITDSGGIQEETTFLKVPCVTLRKNTERPETVDIGTNELVGGEPSAIRDAVQRLVKGKWKTGGIPDYWDGHTSDRIINILKTIYDHS